MWLLSSKERENLDEELTEAVCHQNTNDFSEGLPVIFLLPLHEIQPLVFFDFHVMFMFSFYFLLSSVTFNLVSVELY